MKRVQMTGNWKKFLFFPMAVFLVLPLSVLGAQTNKVCASQCNKASVTCNCRHMGRRHLGFERHQALMRIQKQMQTNDEHLNQLIATMNKATGRRKVDDIAAALNAMVLQREQMQHSMAAFHRQMMQYSMREHGTWHWKSPEHGPMNGANTPANGQSQK